MSQWLAQGHNPVTHGFMIFTLSSCDDVTDSNSYTWFAPLWWWFSTPVDCISTLLTYTAPLSKSYLTECSNARFSLIWVWTFLFWVTSSQYGFSFWCDFMIQQMLVRICEVTVCFASWLSSPLHYAVLVELAKMIQDELRLWVVAVTGRR